MVNIDSNRGTVVVAAVIDESSLALLEASLNMCKVAVHTRNVLVRLQKKLVSDARKKNNSKTW